MACGGQEVHLEGVCLCNSKPSIVHMSLKSLWQECSNHCIGDHSQSDNQLSSPLAKVLLPSFSDFSNKTQYVHTIYIFWEDFVEDGQNKNIGMAM